MTADDDGEGIQFELVAASLRADASDAKAFLAALAAKLRGALPQQTSVKEGGGGLFGGKKHVEAIEVDLGEMRFRVEESGGRLVAMRSKAVRGIVLKSEPVPLELWIDDLSRLLAGEAERSESGRMALQQMLENS